MATWYTYDAARRPIWLRSTPAGFDPVSLTWRAELLRSDLDPKAEDVKAPVVVGAVSMRFLADDPSKIAVRWSLDSRNAPPQDECLVDALGESSGIAQPPSRAWTPDLGQVEVSTTVVQSATWSGERVALLAHDSVGAPIWMIGTRAAGSTSSLALAYYYSNYPGGLPVTACAHSGCVSAARPAGEFVAGARSGVEFNVQVNSAEVGPRLESRDSRR